MKGKATKQVARYTPGPLEVVPWGGGKFAVRPVLDERLDAAAANPSRIDLVARARELTAEAAKQEPKPTTESEPKERWLISTTLHLSRVEECVILHIYDDEQKARVDFESIHYGDPIRLCKIVEEK